MARAISFPKSVRNGVRIVEQLYVLYVRHCHVSPFLSALLASSMDGSNVGKLNAEHYHFPSVWALFSRTLGTQSTIAKIISHFLRIF